MKLAFWRRRKATPAPPFEAAESPKPKAEPKDIDCKYCGPVHAVPDEHLASPEHRLAQAVALAPGDGEDDEAADADLG